MRPKITLTYAQSLNGCIAARPGERLILSGPEAMRMTHMLRATHDGILIGIGTLLADNPRLSVRLVDGPHPQPIIVDSHLRCPNNCHLLQNPVHPLWILTTQHAPAARQTQLEQSGARVIRVPANPQSRVDLSLALDAIQTLGIEKLMIEGGAAIITEVLRTQLADHLVLTIAPRIVNGVHGITQGSFTPPTLSHVRQYPLGADTIVEADMHWTAVEPQRA